MLMLFRILLTLAMVYGAYIEAGFFTALALLFVSANNELQAWTITKLSKIIRLSVILR